MNPALVDVLDWVEELRDDLRANMPRRGVKREPYFDFAKCGTVANYRQHLRLGIPVCGSCKQAEALRHWKYRMREGNRLRANARRAYAQRQDEIRGRTWMAGQ